LRVPDAVQRERSKAVRRWSGTFAKVVCVTIPGLLRIIPLRSMLRSARDTRLS
jgi:Na+-driven multidrug efflux pump